jgi:hypothetical protein
MRATSPELLTQTTTYGVQFSTTVLFDPYVPFVMLVVPGAESPENESVSIVKTPFSQKV